ncbi:DNA-binding transcriptional regulator LsrR (DeoR family) [Tamaricihabitans halophyticus]|uniref:DNA-binding transcriptional regulator LsrR (DeoR family) n=1 Tax=Tamaricihabitans halophyticus TaxID=1262583 RepID=A0A4R2QVF0_9PSEU|nr:sugar-binding transcriptional regulator [Tamaricihabitans halophyticus]TCP54020.1 DNA-binding transcriptional regulator LsrR (DeoR family) [Tamaricihabitans halophyticus]
MPPPRDQDLLVRTARLYYQENQSQQEIAEALSVSRSNVSRMLTAARERGIVEIRINDPSGRELDLERELSEVFGLRDCRVADAHGSEHPLPKVGDLGGRWLQENLRSGQRIGVSWGRSLQAVVQHVPDSGGLDVEVVPLVGGLSSVDSEITGEELVRDLAGRLGGRFQRLHAPAVLTSRAGRDVLLAEPSIASALESAREVSVALVGIGSFGTGSSAAIVETLNLGTDERAEFEAAKPAGDLCARYFDGNGSAIIGPAEDRVLAISLADLRQIPMVVGIAAGPEKTRGVLGALRSSAVDVLICDSSLARALLADRDRLGG